MSLCDVAPTSYAISPSRRSSSILVNILHFSSAILTGAKTPIRTGKKTPSFVSFTHHIAAISRTCIEVKSFVL